MEAGQNGGLGKNALKPVGKATKPEPEVAATLQLNMEEDRVKAMQWSQLCAA